MQFVLARPIGKEIIEISPGDLLYKVNLSEKLIEIKKYDEAFKILEDAIDRLDTFPRIMFLMSKIFFNKGELEKAISFVEKEIKNNPRIADSYNLLGSIYLKQDLLKKAKQAYTEAQRKDPENFQALYGLGFVNFNEAQYDASAQLFLKAAKVDPNNPLVRRQLGYVYMKLGQRTLAEEAFKVYLEIKPDADAKAEIQNIIATLQ